MAPLTYAQFPLNFNIPIRCMLVSLSLSITTSSGYAVSQTFSTQGLPPLLTPTLTQIDNNQFISYSPPLEMSYLN